MKPPNRPLTFLWYYIKYFKFSFFLLLIFQLVWAVNEALFPYFIKLFVDGTQYDLSPDASLWENFHLPILAVVGCWTLMELSTRLAGIIEIYLFSKFRLTIRKDVFAWVSGQSIDYFTSNLAGSIGSKIADIPKSSQHVIEHFLWTIISVLFIFAVSLVAVAQASFIFTLVMFFWFVAHIGVTLYYLQEIEDKTSSHYESLATLNGETIDTVSNAISMKIFSRVAHEEARIKRFQDIEVKKYIIAGWAFQKVNFLRGLASLLFIFTTLYLLLRGWKDGWLSVGDFPLVAMSSFNLMGYVWHMSMALLEIFRDLGTLKGALSLVSVDHKVKDKPGAGQLTITKGFIEFQNVTFGYRESDFIFSNLCVVIPAHQKVGLVGLSGSGKTTFANLILRAYDLNSGRICIDSQDISQVTQDSLRDQITLIPQDPSLFHRSVKENIHYGNLNATHPEVEEASRLAHCHEFVMHLEQGYETVVGEHGLKLSGGQRQRLSIARAFLKKAPILILDEATSALDSFTEEGIQENLAHLMKNKTTIVIAHRLSTLRHMDRILVFHRGTIIEEGTQNTLLKKNGHFARLWSLQQDGFLPDILWKTKKNC